LSKKRYSHSLELVGSGNRSERDLHKQTLFVSQSNLNSLVLTMSRSLIAGNIAVN